MSDRKRVVLRNEFHGTEVAILVPSAWTEEEAWAQLEAADQAVQGHYHYAHTPAHRRLVRVRQALCGMTDCACGTVR